MKFRRTSLNDSEMKSNEMKLMKFHENLPWPRPNTTICWVLSKVGGSRFGFSEKEKQNKMSQTTDLISNLCWILCFSRSCLLNGKVGVDLKLVYCRGFFKITGILLSKYTNRKQFTVGDSSKLLEHYFQNILIVVL